MQDQLSNFDAFLKHGSAVSFALSLAFGWGVSIFTRFPIHKLVKDDGWATWFSYAACVLGSFLVTLCSWPNDYRGSWAAAMSVISPLLGFVALWQIKKRWPDLYAILAVRKVTPELPGDSTGTEAQVPPPGQ